MADDPTLLQRIGRAAKRVSNSPGGKIVGSILKETPVGAGINVARDIIDIFDGSPDDPEDILAERMAAADPDTLVKLQGLRVDLIKTELEVERDKEVAGIEAATERLRIDTLGDNKLSKNVRPWVCIGVVAAAVSYTFLTLFALVGSLVLVLFYGYGDSVVNLASNPLIGLAMTGMVSLWASATTAIGFYFKGRTDEKKTSIGAVERVLDPGEWA